MNRLLLIVLLIVVAFAIASCAPDPNPEANRGDNVAGFWQGLWHGFVALFTFIWSLFSDKVTMYEVNNNGGWYNFGYLLGVMMFWGGGGNGAARGRRGWSRAKRSGDA